MEVIFILNKRTISIIVPVYNVEKHLGNCLESILNQLYSNYEVIIVNDGSTDNSTKICEEYAVRDTRIKIINKNNGGVSSARNAGLDNMVGDYFTFVDADDTIEPEFLSTLIQNAESNKADISICNYRSISNHLKEHYSATGKRDINAGKHFSFGDAYGETIVVSACRKLYKTKAFSGHRFDESMHYAEDTLFSFYCLEKAEIVCYEDVFLYNYVLRSNSAMQGGFTPKMFGRIIAYQQMLEYCKENHVEAVDWLEYCLYDRTHKVYIALTNSEGMKKEYVEKYNEYKKYLVKNLKKYLRKKNWRGKIIIPFSIYFPVLFEKYEAVRKKRRG